VALHPPPRVPRVLVQQYLRFGQQCAPHTPGFTHWQVREQILAECGIGCGKLRQHPIRRHAQVPAPGNRRIQHQAILSKQRLQCGQKFGHVGRVRLQHPAPGQQPRAGLLRLNEGRIGAQPHPITGIARVQLPGQRRDRPRFCKLELPPQLRRLARCDLFPIGTPQNGGQRRRQRAKPRTRGQQ